MDLGTIRKESLVFSSFPGREQKVHGQIYKAMKARMWGSSDRKKQVLSHRHNPQKIQDPKLLFILREEHGIIHFHKFQSETLLVHVVSPLLWMAK